MDVSIGRFIKRITPHYVFGFLLLTVCPLLFPKIGEQQYSYVQGLCFLLLAWLGLVFQIQKHKQVMGVCLLILLVHVFWIKPVNLSIWRWVDAVGLSAFYVFVRKSSSKDIRVLLACAIIEGFVIHCLQSHASTRLVA